MLDEPTSALDSVSEQLFIETIRGLKGTATLVIVAHRPTTLAACDRILVLKNGRVDQLGSPGEITVDPATVDLTTGDLTTGDLGTSV